MRCGRLPEMATPPIPDRRDPPGQTTSEDPRRINRACWRWDWRSPQRLRPTRRIARAMTWRGATAATWPTVALIGSHELLRMTIRSAAGPRDQISAGPRETHDLRHVSAIGQGPDEHTQEALAAVIIDMWLMLAATHSRPSWLSGTGGIASGLGRVCGGEPYYFDCLSSEELDDYSDRSRVGSMCPWMNGRFTVDGVRQPGRVAILFSVLHCQPHQIHPPSIYGFQGHTFWYGRPCV
jgi:hypothetical protein